MGLTRCIVVDCVSLSSQWILWFIYWLQAVRQGCVLHRQVFETGNSHASNSQGLLHNSFSEISLQIAVLTEWPCLVNWQLEDSQPWHRMFFSDKKMGLLKAIMGWPYHVLLVGPIQASWPCHWKCFDSAFYHISRRLIACDWSAFKAYSSQKLGISLNTAHQLIH